MQTSKQITDNSIKTSSGFLALGAVVLLSLAGLYLAGTSFAGFPNSFDGWRLLLGIVSFVIAGFVGNGLYTLAPNESAVHTFFGDYVGTDHDTGYHWTNPFRGVERISRRLNTHEIKAIKVNDAAGNPIEIGAIVVWQVTDAAKSILEVEDTGRFVHSQAESALRQIAGSHAYDAAELEDLKKDKDAGSEGEVPEEVSLNVTLLKGGKQITDALEAELRERFLRAGVDVVEARINHLAYAPEIASVMLKRQQADAVIAARKKIVDGAVKITSDAIAQLGTAQVKYDDAAKAQLAANLLTVLVSEREVSPVLPLGN